MKAYIHIIVFVLFGNAVLGQNKLIKKAQSSFTDKNYFEVVNLLNKLQPQETNQLSTVLKGESYRLMHNYTKALEMYNKLDWEQNQADSLHLHYADILMSNGYNELAHEHFEIYASKHPDNKAALARMKQDNSAQFNKNKDYKISPIAANTSKNDMVGFQLDNDLYIATSGFRNNKKVHNWDGQQFINFYRWDKTKDNKTPELIKGLLSSKRHEGPGFYDTISKTLYFTRNNSLKSNYSHTARVANLKLFKTKRTASGWTHPKELSINDNTYSRGHPTGISGKNFLIYSSNQSGGYGDVDLYITYNVNGSWTAPTNLGNAINTEGKEIFPYLANDSTLYFSSDGHGGFGSLDLFKAKFKGDSIYDIENLGHKFNTPHDDFGIVFENPELTIGYFSSDRQSAIGGSDIYHFRQVRASANTIFLVKNEKGTAVRDLDLLLSTPQSVAQITTNASGCSEWSNTSTHPFTVKAYKEGYKLYEREIHPEDISDTIKIVLSIKKSYVQLDGKIVEDVTESPISGTEVVVQLDDKMYTDTTDKEGNFDLLVPKSGRIRLTYKKDGYLSSIFTPNFSINQLGSLPMSLKLVKPSKGLLLDIENIYYEYDEAYITTKAEPVLDSLANLLAINPKLEIEIRSHTDSRGSIEYNEILSIKRAKAVVDYLTRKDISKERLYVKYYGEDQLANNCIDGTNCGEVKHALNRRTEFRVVRY